MRRAVLVAARGLAQSCEVLAGLLLLAVTAINLTQVTGRYLFASSLPWGEEIMRYTMIWVMMLGGVACFWRVEHMAIDALHDAVPVRLRPLVRGALYGVAGIFCLLLLVYGWPAALRNTSQFAAASGISMVWVYLAIPVGAALMLVQIVLCWIAGYEPVEPNEEGVA
jgi:TRAP-type C4-dicarboxylate transport system permease small subunit